MSGLLNSPWGHLLFSVAIVVLAYSVGTWWVGR
jgi:hypothetical protein